MLLLGTGPLDTLDKSLHISLPSEHISLLFHNLTASSSAKSLLSSSLKMHHRIIVPCFAEFILVYNGMLISMIEEYSESRTFVSFNFSILRLTVLPGTKQTFDVQLLSTVPVLLLDMDLFNKGLCCIR